MKHFSDIAVLGTGIVGLEAAHALKQAGCPVTNVYTDRDPENTLSATVPPAIILPHPPAFNAAATTGAGALQRLMNWQSVTLDYYRNLASCGTEGVATRTGTVLLKQSAPDPVWRDDYRASFRTATPNELPSGFGSGWHLETIVTRPDVRIRLLVDALRQKGVQIVQTAPLASLQEATETYPQHDAWVVSPGLNARTLVPDENIFGVRGQLVQVTLPQKIADTLPGFLLDDPEQEGLKGDGFTYVVQLPDMPGNHERHLILGGTCDPVDTLQAPSPDTIVRGDIWSRCIRLMPELADARFVKDRSGIRPCRKGGARFEWVTVNGKPMLLHYGHGGNGVSQSIGSASSVVDECSHMQA